VEKRSSGFSALIIDGARWVGKRFFAGNLQRTNAAIQKNKHVEMIAENIFKYENFTIMNKIYIGI